MAKWRNIIQGIKKDDDKHRHENKACKNCDTVFSGRFCPECGQAVRDYDRPFTFIFYNFMGDFFAFDTRFFRTFKALLFKPGFLTSEYFKGKRVRYAPPFRIYIFISFILFLLLQINTNRGLSKVLDSDIGDSIGLDSTSNTKTDSLLNAVKTELGTTDSMAVDSILSEFGVANNTIDTSSENAVFTLNTLQKGKGLRQRLNSFADEKEDELEDITDPEERSKTMKYIRLARSPEQVVAKFLEYLSWSFFLLLPIFALLLKFLYFRRKQNYIRHLIFSIHIHSFVFVVFTIVLLIFMITSGDVENSISVSSELKNISIILFLSVPVYVIIAIKKFYGQSWGKVILKFISISFIYNVIFWATVIVVFLNAIGVI